jgi:superfamily I DNA/RNA helicase
MDEAQDLVRPSVLDLLDVWVKGGLRDGRWAFFGDFHRQAIYGDGRSEDVHQLISSRCGFYARANLKQNCRNTRRIAEETALLSGFETPPYRMGQVDGAAVDYLDYTDEESQRRALEEVLLRLAAEPGIATDDVVILSRYRLEQSAAGKLVDSAHFRIRSVEYSSLKDGCIPTFRFATAQAFKGMESKVVVLCDIDRIEGDGDRSLLYVAMSRARSLLTVLLHVRTKAEVREAFRKRLSDLWR